jgi:excinuclease UvrABC nuclease subunit
MTEISEIFDHHLSFDPSADFEIWAKQVPAKWAVYLMADVDDRPLQLLSVRNLHYSLKHRLYDQPDSPASKRVDYRQIVRKIHYRRVDSSFEADWIYHDIARKTFPESYQGMVGFRPAWFVHVDPDARFPRYVKTTALAAKPGNYLGPLEDKHAAARIIELVEDWFDLCRYYNILAEAPHGRACAYKEMGKCPAPCDGSISMDQYRYLIRWSSETLADPKPFIRGQKQRMEQAAAELRFEIAAKIKGFIEQLGQLGKGTYRHIRRLDDFNFVSIQSGPKTGFARVFLILRGMVEEIAGLIAEPKRPSELMRLILESIESREVKSLETVEIERIGIVTHHLFSPKSANEIFVPVSELNEQLLIQGYRRLLSKKQDEPQEAEGVVKELQRMTE